ncbi:heterokaryon incompatibility protein-domain-containing protein [Cadophora sp. MPI-SDFR-AT-0126]|nr:heterokaryon incompatibility protein-domain-containing protein [Leotiomycetes sp. MPI-SDFR-AT-0126]
MSGSTSPSIYLPLDPVRSQIRLIYLQPPLGSESDSDTIICSIHTADLDDEICMYNALSYEWGTERNGSFSILLSGKEIVVTENLWRALRLLRYEQSALPLWVDALCINQTDDTERSSQVRQMGRIYQRASCVIAWLKPEADVDSGNPAPAEEAIQLAELLYGTSEPTRYYYRPEAGYWRPSQYPLSGETSKRTNVPVTYCHPGWVALLSLFQKSYWTRLWILQELVLASHIVIQNGHLKMNWEALEHIHDQITNAKNVSGNNQRLNYYAQITRSNKVVEDLSGTVPFKILQQRIARQTVGHELYNLVELVQMYKSAECADIRDKVFGLIGLCSRCCSRKVVVDYQKSPLETCRMLLEHYLSRHSIHGLNLKYGTNIGLFTLVKEIIVTFTNGNIEFPPTGIEDPFPEVFEDPQPESVSMIACVPRRAISLDFRGTDNAGHRKLFDHDLGKEFRLWLLHVTSPPSPAQKYRMCKINRVHYLILRELEDHLSLIGIAQEHTEGGWTKDLPVQADDQVRTTEAALSKVCLYLNFRALKDIILLLSVIDAQNPTCLLLSWNCLSCDYCWNKRHLFGLESRGPLDERDAKMIQDIHTAADNRL